jgi:DHA1 family inner membrane transport protein
VVGTIYVGMAAAGAMLLLFTLTAHHPVTAGLSIFLIGASGSLCLPALQTRLMDVAGDAQGLAAAGNHAALNIGNALGAFLGGAVLAAGFGYTSPAAVGAVLAAAGLGVMALSRRVERRTTGPAQVP